MRKLTPHLAAVLVGLCLFGLGQATARPAAVATQAAPLSHAFTYQGRLKDGSVPANGSYTLTFRLYDALEGGTQIGPGITLSGVAVQDGLFTVQLDFGATSFDGNQRFLEVQVATTILTPRQALTATPYALFALQAAQATSALSAVTVPWSGLTGVPADLADGDANMTYTAGSGLAMHGTQFSVDPAAVQTRVGSSCAVGNSIRAIASDGTVTCEDDTDTIYTAGNGLVLSGTELRAEGSPYANTIVVAKSGGDFSSVQAALNSITDASATNPYLVYVAAGVYTEQVTLKSYVTLEGAGEGSTILRWTGGSQDYGDAPVSATVIGASHTRLRHLTVESNGAGQPFAIAVLNNHVTSVTMSHVTVSATGADIVRAVLNASSSMATMSDATISTSGVSTAQGIANYSSSATMSDVTVSSPDTAVYNLSSIITIRHSVLTGYTSVQRFGGVVKVVNSQLSGQVGVGLTCFDNYNENLAAVTCP